MLFCHKKQKNILALLFQRITDRIKIKVKSRFVVCAYCFLFQTVQINYIWGIARCYLVQPRNDPFECSKKIFLFSLWELSKFTQMTQLDAAQPSIHHILCDGEEFLKFPHFPDAFTRTLHQMQMFNGRVTSFEFQFQLNMSLVNRIFPLRILLIKKLLCTTKL